MSDEGGGLASLGAGGPPAQPGEEVLGLLLGDLGALPGAQPLDGDQRGEDGQHEAVPHVEDAHHLQRGEVNDCVSLIYCLFKSTHLQKYTTLD